MKRAFLVTIAFLLFVRPVLGGFLTASFAPVATGNVINLTEAGPLDWVHWGLLTDSSIERKAGVVPQISDFTVLPTDGSTFAYRFADNWNGYSWTDGAPQQIVTNTPTGVWAYGIPAIGTGFQLSIPAGTNMQTLRVYVGAYAARGRFTASLSDESAAAYTNPLNAAINNNANGPSGVYTINFSADSPDQTLIVTYTVQTAYRPDGNVTLQAAALSAPGANNLPFVALTSPAQTTNVDSQSEIVLSADATDTDGSVMLVEFYAGETKLGESAGPEFSITWSNPPPGRHILTARATDSMAGMSISAPVTLFVSGAGGSISGSSAVSPTTLNLSAEGNADWAHRGYADASSFNHRSAGGSQISNPTRVGTNAVTRYTNNRTAFSWDDGSPEASVASTTTGVYISGPGNGFEFTTPADTNTRTLRVYCGLYGSRGEFQAWLSDFSGMAFIDTSVSNVFGSTYLVYTLKYTAATNEQRLHVRYTTSTLFDFDYGNVNWQAATLQGSPSTPLVLTEPAWTPSGFTFSFPTESGGLYSVQYSTTLGDANWQTLTNIHGSGDPGVVIDAEDPPEKRFYRVLAE